MAGERSRGWSWGKMGAGPREGSLLLSRPESSRQVWSLKPRSHSFIHSFHSFFPFLEYIKFVLTSGPRTVVLKVWSQDKCVSIIGGLLDKHVRSPPQTHESDAGGGPRCVQAALGDTGLSSNLGTSDPEWSSPTASHSPASSSSSCRSQQSCPLPSETVPDHPLKHALPKSLSMLPSCHPLMFFSSWHLTFWQAAVHLSGYVFALGLL